MSIQYSVHFPLSSDVCTKYLFLSNFNGNQELKGHDASPLVVVWEGAIRIGIVGGANRMDQGGTKGNVPLKY